MRRLAVVALAALALLAGCGKSGIVAVRRPRLPIYVCWNPQEAPSNDCAGRFNAGRLVGLRLREASRLAEAHGYAVVQLWPQELYTELPARPIGVELAGAHNSIVVRVLARA